ncbi:MAG: iron ABC transporter permease [Candidatus Hydrothermota bacterium]|nr:MAG: iron ABC transporter permease [Candidatus Hydrothermae bacterium]
MKLRFAILFFLTVAAISLSLFWGPAGFFPGREVMSLRAMRAFLALLAGATLALNGAALQALFLNPLADPYVLGIASGAALGYAAGLVLGFSTPFFVSLFGILGGAGVFIIVYLLSRRNGVLNRNALLLAGVVMSFLTSSLVMILMVSHQESIYRMLYVLWGYLGRAISKKQLPAVFAVSLIVMACDAVLFLLSKELDALSLGDEEALSMGVDVEKVKRLLFLLSSVSIGILVSLVGSIGFVGLMVPHIARRVVGPCHRNLMPFSFLLGVLFLSLADLISRNITPYELPVGVVTSLFGVPFFLYLLSRGVYESYRG